LALNYRQSRDLETAADVYSDLLARGVGDVGVYIGAGIVEALLGRHEEAARLFQVAEEIGLDAFRLPQVAHGYTLAGQHDHAQRLFGQFEQEAENNSVGDANAWSDPELEKPEFREVLDGLWNDE
jgi:hypothetical protein